MQSTFKKFIFSAGLVFILGIGLLPISNPTVASAKSNSNKKITICHATGSEKNPFVEITISNHGWENGHKGHQNERDFAVVSDKSCSPEQEQGQEPTPTPESPKQIAGVSIAPEVSPEVSAAKTLPKGGGNSNLATSLMIGLGLVLVSALISETAKKLKLA